MIEFLCECTAGISEHMPSHLHRMRQHYKTDEHDMWVMGAIDPTGKVITETVEEIIVPIDWRALYKALTTDPKETADG